MIHFRWPIAVLMVFMTKSMLNLSLILSFLATIRELETEIRKFKLHLEEMIFHTYFNDLKMIIIPKSRKNYSGLTFTENNQHHILIKRKFP